MNIAAPTRPADTTAEHYDVLIVGAGISGIDAAYHLKTYRPGKSFAVLESQAEIGGTWHTHRFPGIRSDSDLFTFGFSWKPWTGAPIATADKILGYLNEAVNENALRSHIQFETKVLSADWNSAAQQWVLQVSTDGGSTAKTVTCSFLWMCAGYYRHSAGYTPEWPGMAQFTGDIVHPQTWPDTLDHAGKRVAVIGSGATAATLVPALAETAEHVTMVQRSPTYYYPRPIMDEFNETLSALGLPDDVYHDIMRRKFLRDGEMTAERARSEPDALAADFIEAARSYLGPDFDIETHFTPSYRPWRQRVAVVPDGDLFVAIREGKADVATGDIETFTPSGLRLSSGQEISADVIVTATGLTLNMFGDIDIKKDGELVDIAKHFTHRGIMFSDIPNFATVFGYLRTSWTMRADLVARYLIRMMDAMEKAGHGSVTPTLRADEYAMQPRPWIDPENFNAGYIMRSLDQLPRQGDRQPWIMTQDYFQDREILPTADLNDGSLVYQPMPHSQSTVRLSNAV